jgi:hypothetical protein
MVPAQGRPRERETAQRRPREIKPAQGRPREMETAQGGPPRSNGPMVEVVEARAGPQGEWSRQSGGFKARVAKEKVAKIPLA